MTTAKPAAHRIEREDVELWLLAFTPVLAWIVAQGFSFLAARSICETGNRSMLYLFMGAGLGATLHLPDGRTEVVHTEAQDEVGVLRCADTDQSGLYRATIGQG